MAYIFERDSANAERNVRKHGVTFDEAATAFSDPLSLLMLDPNSLRRGGALLRHATRQERRQSEAKD